jgi:phenylalanyl-tRNA synthetase beta chain
MQVPISWLKEYVDLNMPIAQLADRLTLAGLEVEAIEPSRRASKNTTTTVFRLGGNPACRICTEN